MTQRGVVSLVALQNDSMKLTLGNKILLVLILPLLFWQYQYATSSACPANTVSKAYCWGPKGVEFFNINFNQSYLSSSLKVFVFSLIVAAIVSFIISKLKNRGELVAGLFNWLVRIFGIVYIVFSLAVLYWNMSIVY